MSQEPGAKPSSGHSNVARNAYRSIRRWGIAWRVKLDVYNYHCEDGSVLPCFTHSLLAPKEAD